MEELQMQELLAETDEDRQARDHTIRTLYHQLLEHWNNRDAARFAALFTPDANVIGFDGSMMNGQAAIATSLQAIFADHPTAAYVGIIREVRLLTPQTALLRAVAGMVPPGKAGLNPAVNTVQSVIAVQGQTGWRITLYQNTPAQFHGRPELVQQLTDELQQALTAQRQLAAS